MKGALALVMVCALSACGFHLRGTAGEADSKALPPVIALHREAGVPRETGDAVESALERSGARHAAEGDASVPVLVLRSERVARDLIAASGATGKATEYRLHLDLRFSWNGSGGGDLRTVTVYRDFHYDPAQALAQEWEERALLSALRLEAAERLVGFLR